MFQDIHIHLNIFLILISNKHETVERGKPCHQQWLRRRQHHHHHTSGKRRTCTTAQTENGGKQHHPQGVGRKAAPGGNGSTTRKIEGESSTTHKEVRSAKDDQRIFMWENSVCRAVVARAGLVGAVSVQSASGSLLQRASQVETRSRQKEPTAYRCASVSMSESSDRMPGRCAKCWPR